MTRADIVTEARAWIGTRWQHQAMVKGVGCDCIGLIVGVALAVGIAEARTVLETPEYRNYGRQPDGTTLLRGCSELLDPVRRYEAQPGDVLLMKFQTDPQHFAFLSAINPGCIIHAYAGARRVVEHAIDATWNSRVVGAFRIRGLA